LPRQTSLFIVAAVTKPVAIDLIAAARPNFMKVAPLYHALAAESWCAPRIVHTGQHYDANMSDAFFADLGLPKPHVHLGVGGGGHGEQTGRVMIEYEKVCLASRPDWIVVVGDVNSTLACALVGAKLGIPVAHLEAGLRSGDRRMPEEINRLATDAIADVLWTPSPDGNEHLAREGVPADKVELVGNIMLDSFELLAPKIRVPCSSAHAPAAARLRSRRAARSELVGSRPFDRAAVVHRVHEPGLRLPVRAHGLGRRAGGDELSRYSLSYAAREHGAAGHGIARDESARDGGKFFDSDRTRAGRAPAYVVFDPALGWADCGQGSRELAPQGGAIAAAFDPFGGFSVM